MLKIDLHTHTIASGHAFNTIYEMAAEAKRKGVKILGITDHGPVVSDRALFGESYFSCFDRLPRMIYGVKMIYGVELSIINKNGDVDLPEKFLKKLDYASGFHVVRSVPLGTTEENTELIIKGIKNPNISKIVHPYLLANLKNIDMEKIYQTACDYNKLMEISTVHFEFSEAKIVLLNKDDMENLIKMIKIIKKNKQKVLLSSDAHVASEIGIDSGIRKYFKQLGLAEKDIANNDIKYLRRFIKNI